MEEVVLRHLDADDGSTVIAKNIRYQSSIQLLCFFASTCLNFVSAFQTIRLPQSAAPLGIRSCIYSNVRSTLSTQFTL
jgi:hypothetical protein